MPTAQLLIVDDEPAVHQLADRILRPEGYALWTARNGEEALRLASRSHPDLVVTDVNMPVMDGWTLVKRLRSTAALALVPVLFLTARSATEDHLRGFRLGADDYLEKSSDFWDLAKRVARALARGRELGSSLLPPSGRLPATSRGLRGSFDQVGLASLLTVLEMGERGGILRVRRARPQEEGILYLVRGRVHRADLASRKDLRNREAVYELLGWSQGTYEFSAEPLRVTDQVEMPTATLLLEGARRIDEGRSRA